MASPPVRTVSAEPAQDGFDEAHRELLADDRIQFSLEPYEADPPPDWLLWLIENFAVILPYLKIIFWVGLAVLALFLLYKLAGRLGLVRWRKAAPAGSEEQAWRPEEGPARALLAEADQLAGEARFDEAARLLLFRSIEDIDARRPRLVRPALTSRDIAGAPDLPEAPRNAFATIVRQVELSLFGGKRLGEQDWLSCRAAYEDIAFAESWKA